MKLKRFFSEVITLAAFALIGWLAVSWVDIVLHNNPIYGGQAVYAGQCDCTVGGDGRVGGKHDGKAKRDNGIYTKTVLSR